MAEGYANQTVRNKAIADQINSRLLELRYCVLEQARRSRNHNLSGRGLCEVLPCQQSSCSCQIYLGCSGPTEEEECEKGTFDPKKMRPKNIKCLWGSI